MRRSRKTLLTLFGDRSETTTGVVDYAPVHVSLSTFQGGLSERVHRWFRLTPSFGPALVRRMLESLSAKTGDIVLDPFSGAATTLIESRLEGFETYGYEINPFLHFVGETCLNWAVDAGTLSASLEQIGNRFAALEASHGKASLESIPFPLPPIHNVTRWWRPDVLKRLLFLKAAINEVPAPSIRAFFRLTLAGVLVPELTNVTLGRLQLFFIDRAHDHIDVWHAFSQHAKVMIEDVGSLQGLEEKHPATLISGDSVSFTPPPGKVKFDLVITSPPYPNRYSYVWNTRPHLYLLDFFRESCEASKLDKVTVGGTWGTATSILGKGKLAPFNAAVAASVGDVAEDIRKNDNLMANYCMKYFNGLAEHLTNQKAFLAPGARLAYVVGCSRLKGVYVETDVLLGRLFDALGLGYKCTRIERFRKRHSGRDLHESVVYATCE